MQSVVIVVELS